MRNPSVIMGVQYLFQFVQKWCNRSNILAICRMKEQLQGGIHEKMASLQTN